MTGADLISSHGSRSSYGTDLYDEASRLKRELNQLGYSVRIVSLARRGNRRSLGTYKLTWWTRDPR